MQVVVEVPDRYLVDETTESLGRQMKLALALLMFRTRRLSAGAASELAGVDRYTFLDACKEHAIPIADYTPEELDTELAWLESRASN